MAIERGDVVLVAFPYVERDRVRERPGLVISDGAVGEEQLCWVLMITSASNRAWPLDVDCGLDYQRFGLRIPSFIRTTKVSTFEARMVRRIGKLSEPLMAQVDGALGRILGRS